jgi:DNA-binding NtrC family response regulator
MLQRILLVEPNADRRQAFAAIMATGAAVQSCADFQTARRAVSDGPLDLVVTNLRLGPFNGLHLVYLSRARLIRSVVYDRKTDLFLAREAQSAGAFYESADRLPLVLLNYVMLELPPVDRRDPAHADRRALRRGGRRAADLALLQAI